VRAVRKATLDELAKAPGMTRQAAVQVSRYFTELAAREPADGSAADAADSEVSDGDDGAEVYDDDAPELAEDLGTEDLGTEDPAPVTSD
jgi:hypothetical protein